MRVSSMFVLEAMQQTFGTKTNKALQPRALAEMLNELRSRWATEIDEVINGDDDDEMSEFLKLGTYSSPHPHLILTSSS